MNDIERKLKQAHLAKAAADALRADLLAIEKRIRDLRGVIPPLADNTAVDMAELSANVTLAFRHCEDARMRLGKAIQALDGGVSIFDKASPH